MAHSISGRGTVLLMRAGGQTCALAAADVVEVLRPLPVRRLAGAPDALGGVTVIRGRAVPVVALSRILHGAGPPANPTASARYVVLRTGARQVALLVDEVPGTAELAAWGGSEIPPLLQHAVHDAIETIRALDRDLLVVLQGARLIPAELAQPVAEP